MTDTMDIKITRTTVSRLQETNFENLGFGKTFSDHMFMADFVDGEWKNLEIVPFENIPMNPANATLHYGQSIFEGLKAHKNKNGEVFIFRPDANAKRLIRSAERMCMPPVPEEMFLEAVRTLVSVDKGWVPDGEGTSLYIRPFQFANDPFLGVRASVTYKFMVIVGPAGGYFSAPVRVKIETKYTRAAKGGVGAAKTAGNYAASLYPAKLAADEGYNQVIWTDAQNHEFIEESGAMNVMFVINDTLITAPLSETILPGITRDSALTLAREWGLKVEERPVRVKEVIDAIKDGSLSEAFGIGTAAVISHIATIGHEGTDYDLPALETRKISNRLHDELNRLKMGEGEDKHGWVMKVD